MALLVGFTMGGVPGMFVAVPTIAVVMAVNRAVLDVLGTTGTSRFRSGEISPPGSIGRTNGAGDSSSRSGLVWLVVAILSQFPVVVGPVVVAVTLAATFLPAVKALERRG